jgi:hypothetical protein
VVILAVADRQQLVLHLLAGQRIEGAEGLVEQQDARAGHQARAIATRCAMPPESWCG